VFCEAFKREGIMNTSANVSPVNNSNAGGRFAHIFRDHNLKLKRVSSNRETENQTHGAIILQKYKSKEPGKVGTSKITKHLSVYRKRYEEAIKKNDEKTAQRNLAKITALEAELQQTKKARRGREATAVDISWSITKFPPAEALKYDPNILNRLWEKCGKQIMSELFPEIPIEDIGVAGHVDQASLHFHTYFDVPDDTTFTALIKDNKYAEIQQRWNELVRAEFNDLPIETITPWSDRKEENPYLELAEYKRLTEMQSSEPIKSTTESTEIALEAQKALLEAQSTILEQSSVIEHLKAQPDDTVELLEHIAELHTAIKHEATPTELKQIVTEQEGRLKTKEPYKTAIERRNEAYKARLDEVRQIKPRQNSTDIRKAIEELDRFNNPKKDTDTKLG
jgi:hypothetical protein